VASVRINGFSYEYLWWGNGPALAPVLLLHEAGGHARGWGDFPKRLADATGRRVFAYSRLGWGDSEPRPQPLAPGYLEDEALDVLPAVRAALGLERVVLVGHHEGATIGLIHAGAAATPVEGVVAIAPLLFVDNALRFEVLNRFQRGLHEAHAAAASEAERTFSEWAQLWGGTKLEAWTIDDFCRGVTCPALGLRGDQDIFTHSGHLDRLRALVKHLEVLQLPGARHLPFLDKPAAVSDAVAAFAHKLP
jgi:pimeloyl-ACP methyl ester carboxylesterase